MSQSTPIYNIQRDNMQQHDQSREIQNLIDNNVDEMYGNQMGGGEYNEPSIDQAYQMQQADMESYQMQNPGYRQEQPSMAQLPQMQPQPQPQIPMQMQQQYQDVAPSNLYVPDNLRGDSVTQPKMNFNNFNTQGLPPHKNEEWTEYLLREFKDSIIVAALFIILNVSIVQNLLKMYIPYLDNAYLELVVRALISGVLFYFVKRYWKV